MDGQLSIFTQKDEITTILLEFTVNISYYDHRIALER